MLQSCLMTYRGYLKTWRRCFEMMSSMHLVLWHGEAYECYWVDSCVCGVRGGMRICVQQADRKWTRAMSCGRFERGNTTTVHWSSHLNVPFDIKPINTLGLRTNLAVVCFIFHSWLINFNSSTPPCGTWNNAPERVKKTTLIQFEWHWEGKKHLWRERITTLKIFQL